MRNALSVDVEDYFQVETFAGVVRREDWPSYPSRVEANTRRLLDLFEQRHVTATFFVLGWVAERFPALVRDIQERGHEIASHGYWHRPLWTLSVSEFREDLRQATAVIQHVTGIPVRGYRAPTFSVVRSSLWALRVLSEEGFAYDSSVFPIHHDRYGMPDAPRFPHLVPVGDGGELLEFPMTTLPVAGSRLPFCGGGYFRLAPYALIRAGLRRVNAQERQPAIVYIHPWEIDPDQPRIRVRGFNHFRQYVNLHRTLAKLDRLLRDFEFAPVGEVLREQGLAEAA